MTNIYDIFKMYDVLHEIKYMETILAKILVALCYFIEFSMSSQETIHVLNLL
jgi:hypothetical protein